MLERKASIEGLQNELYAMQQTALEQAESSIIELRKTITSLSYPVPVDANGPVRVIIFDHYSLKNDRNNVLEPTFIILSMDLLYNKYLMT